MANPNEIFIIIKSKIAGDVGEKPIVLEYPSHAKLGIPRHKPAIREPTIAPAIKWNKNKKVFFTVCFSKNI
jgi:hypothetical protein